MSQETPVRQNKMGTEPLLPLIVKMALPAVFSMLILSLYNVVDSIYVSRIGESALTAVSLAFPLQMLMTSVGVGTGVGINSLISRRLGEKNQHDADAAACHGLVLGVFNWLVFAFIGLFLTKAFFHLFTEDAVIFHMGVRYTRIVLIFSFGMFIQVISEKTLQATGNMFYPMVFQLVGAVGNIILDPIMIFGYFGLPALGVAGAAYATVISQILAMILCLYVLFAKSHLLHFNFRGFRLRADILKGIYKVGLPAMVMQAIGSVLTTLLNLILISFSETAVTIYGIYFKLQSFFFMPVFGLTQGLMPIMGYNFGARDRKRFLGAYRIGLVIAICVMVAGTLVFNFLPRQLLSLFDCTEEAMAVGIPALRIISYCFPLAACGIVTSNLFQAMGEGTYSLIISLCRQIVLLLPMAYLLSKLWGLRALWWAFPLAEMVALALAIFFFLRLYRIRIRFLSVDDQIQQY